jgi:hypothetical protein
MTKSTAIIFILGFALLFKLEEKVNIFTCGIPIENSKGKFSQFRSLGTGMVSTDNTPITHYSP